MKKFVEVLKKVNVSKNDTLDLMQLCINSYNSKWGKVHKVLDVIADYEVDNVQFSMGYKKRDLETLYIIFRGSDEDLDWKQNFKFKRLPLVQIVTKELEKGNPYSNVNPDVMVHKGFYEDYIKVRTIIHDYIKKGGFKLIYVTGHSKGGAEATLCAVDVQFNFFPDEYDKVICVTYASPRVGNKAFADSFNKRVPRSLRVVNGEDFICKVPYNALGYWHVDNLMHIGYYNPVCWIPVVRGFGSFYHYPKSYKKNLYIFWKKIEKRFA